MYKMNVKKKQRIYMDHWFPYVFFMNPRQTDWIFLFLRTEQKTPCWVKGLVQYEHEHEQLAFEWSNINAENMIIIPKWTVEIVNLVKNPNQYLSLSMLQHRKRLGVMEESITSGKFCNISQVFFTIQNTCFTFVDNNSTLLILVFGRKKKNVKKPMHSDV